MNPENSMAVPGASMARASAPDDRRNGKKLQLTLEAGHPGGAVVLRCQGQIVFHGQARALSTIVAEVLPSAHRMVVDLAEVDSIDSGGLGELVLTHMWAEASGYMLKFARPKKSVLRFFDSTNLLSVFDVYGSVPEAMAAMVQEEIHSA